MVLRKFYLPAFESGTPTLATFSTFTITRVTPSGFGGTSFRWEIARLVGDRMVEMIRQASVLPNVITHI